MNALYTANEAINFNTVQGRRLRFIATSALRVEKFACTTTDLQPLLVGLHNRAYLVGWLGPSRILQVPTSDGHADINILTDYDRIDINTLYTHAQTAETSSLRAAQNSEMLYRCLRNSFDDNTNAVLNRFERQYMLTNQPSGIILLGEYITQCHCSRTRPRILIDPKTKHDTSNPS